MRIIGIDPGSRSTGFGIIDLHKTKYTYVASGCLQPNCTTLPQRLQIIHNHLVELIQQYQPLIFAIEQPFVHHNPASALKLAQARGALLVAAANQQLDIYEYFPTEIKQAVVGTGHASKTQVQYMVRVLLTLSSSPQTDAADALAVAICHAHRCR